MLTLLRDLRRLRRDIALPRPTRGRSLAIRHVDAGSCNGCEHRAPLASSPYYDLQRFGLGIVASPRHADVLLVTGTVTSRMRAPLLVAYNAMPEPRRVAALGDCALVPCSAPRRPRPDPSKLSSQSTSVSQAAHPHRTPSPRRSSGSSTTLRLTSGRAPRSRRDQRDGQKLPGWPAALPGTRDHVSPANRRPLLGAPSRPCLQEFLGGCRLERARVPARARACSVMYPSRTRAGVVCLSNEQSGSVQRITPTTDYIWVRGSVRGL